MKEPLARAVLRGNYRAAFKKEVPDEVLAPALAACEATVRGAQAAGRVMTAALYHYRRMLFFYCESLGSELSPATLLAPLAPFLAPWPGENDADGDRLWVPMTPVFYHARPTTGEAWQRAEEPALRRGRIARLYPEKWTEYVYHHTALVNEGLLLGDRYHFIALHENWLFSYFEEPKTLVNLRGDPNPPSKAIGEWMKTDPDSHFARFDPAQDSNFFFIPAYFALGLPAVAERDSE